MNIQDRIKSALLAVFPTTRHLEKFAADEENYTALQSMLRFAAKHKLITGADKGAFLTFIRSNSKFDSRFSLPQKLNFELFLERKESLLELNLSLRALNDQINELLKSYKLGLPKVTNSMLSRLKKEAADTSHKQNVLRSIAFWIGYNRNHLSDRWNFDSLLRVCCSVKPPMEPTEGVRIGFALSGRGGVIDHAILDWLKKKLKDRIENTIGHISYGRWGKVIERDITNLSVDFPKDDPLQSPIAYRNCLRNAVSLAHQIAIQWALTPYCSQNRFLAIGIVAGEFDDLDTHLLTLFNTRLPGDPVIRLTDFARQCLLTNDIRVSLCDKPREITLINGENLAIWWVTGGWTPLYFDFVPELLQDPLLSIYPKSTTVLYRYLYGIMDNTIDRNDESKPNAVVSFLKAPHNFMLGLEIAKTLYYRRRFWDAIHILWFVLSIDPTYIQARAFLIKLYCNLALESPSQAVAGEFFEQAEEEAHFIFQSCVQYSEDFYCEYGLLHLTRALVMLKYLRNGPHNKGDKELSLQKRRILSDLAEADRLFKKGMLISPLSIRASYLRNSPKIITSALLNNDGIFTDPNQPVDGNPSIIREEIERYQWQYGGLRKDISQGALFEPMKRLFDVYIRNHDDAIALPAYRPATRFCAAVSWWDLFPIRTVGNARKAIALLQEAAEIAGQMDRKGICVYSFTRVYGEMLPAEEFITHIGRSVTMIKESCGGDLEKRRDNDILKVEDETGSRLLMTLNYS